MKRLKNSSDTSKKLYENPEEKFELPYTLSEAFP